ncbi:hypothetical protein PSN45_002537 [Yamadazyma tenuis]|uniref:uncharacterized protein n=1 Tax=Candida tenuis TaxID=2315449 RepID=UPI00279B39FC|nr:hypothetical protein PSN45_002537 [Yamadazyma tenuis]
MHLDLHRNILENLKSLDELKKTLEELRALKGLSVRQDLQSIPPEPANSPLQNTPPQLINDCLHQYWTKFDPCFPIVHRGSFVLPDSYDDDWLVNVMCAIGARYLPEHRHLSCQLYEYITNKSDPFPEHPQLQELQAILLVIYIGIYSGDNSWFKKSFRIYSRLVEFCRESGLFQFNPHDNCDKDWNSFVLTEGRKRFAYGLYLFDSQSAVLFNYPPSLSHYEIKHKLPCCESLWEATTGSEWQSRLHYSPLTQIPHFFKGLQEVLMFGSISGTISSFGAMILLSAVHIMVRNMAQYAGFHAGFKEMSSFHVQDAFTRRSQLGSALNCLRSLLPKKLEPHDIFDMWDEFSVTWNLAYIHLHLPDTVITSGVVEVTLNETIATASALARPQPKSPPGTALLSNDFSKSVYQVLSLTASHIAYFLETFMVDQLETSPVFTFMFYKAALVAWQILNAFKNVSLDGSKQEEKTPEELFGAPISNAQKDYMMKRLVDDMLSRIQSERYEDIRTGFFEKWVESVLESKSTWGVGGCAAASFTSLVSDPNL